MEVGSLPELVTGFTTLVLAFSYVGCTIQSPQRIDIPLPDTILTRDPGLWLVDTNDATTATCRKVILRVDAGFRANEREFQCHLK